MPSICTGFDRRQFLGFALLGCSGARFSLAQNKEPLPGRRATSGDRIEPDWEERLTMTVGPRKADLVGTNEKAIQAAVDYIAHKGGGTVQVLPGTYWLRNAITLRSHVRLRGSGLESVLTKAPMAKTTLAADSDWYDQQITLADPKAFQVGDGVLLRTRNPHNGGTDLAKRTLIARRGNTFKLDQPVRPGDYWVKDGAAVASLFAVINIEGVNDAAVENITLDGNKAHNENMDNNYGAALFMQDTSRVSVRRVTARNFNGDGINWQICHDIVVEDCHSHDNADLGLHPGSGSQRPRIARNRLERNSIGLFLCWGVRNGVAENNTILENRKCGISIGHRDNDNIIRKNEIRNSGEVGILLRQERGPGYAPRGNQLYGNQIVDSGPASGVGIDVQGWADATSIAQNEILETRGPMQRIGIRLGPNTKNIKLVDNKILGFSQAVLSTTRQATDSD